MQLVTPADLSGSSPSKCHLQVRWNDPQLLWNLIQLEGTALQLSREERDVGSGFIPNKLCLPP